MRKTVKRKQRKSRKLKGGDFFSSSNSYSNPNSSYPVSSSYNEPSYLDKALKYVNDSYNNVTNSQPSYTYENPNEKKWWNPTTWFSGGTRRKQRGGNLPDLSLATDVNGIKMAQPTYWIKGGKRKSKRRYRK